MPGLIRGIARTAVVAGTATAVSGRVQRRQAAKFAEADAQAYPPPEAAYEEQPYQQPPQAAPVDVVQQLKDLAELKNQGILTEEEFASQKAKVLGS